MEKDLDTIAKYGGITQEAFDKIDNKTKLEGFINLIDDLEEKKAIKDLQDSRNTMSEEQKLELYNKDAKKINYFALKRSPIYRIFRTEINAIANTKKHGFKYASKYALLDQVPCRFLVQLCILDKPESLSDTKLSEDTKKDAECMNAYLGVAEAVCTVAAQEVLPLIGIAHHFTGWYKSNCVPVMQERIRNKQIKNAETSIAETLSASEVVLISETEKKAA